MPNGHIVEGTIGQKSQLAKKKQYGQKIDLAKGQKVKFEPKK